MNKDNPENIQNPLRIKKADFLCMFKDAFSQIIFPHNFNCLICGDEIKDETKYCICNNCILPFNDGKTCNHCGLNMENEAEYCETCKGRGESFFDKAVSPFAYKDNAVKLIHDLKFGGKRYIAKYLGTAMLDRLKKLNITDFDFIVPVPLSQKGMRLRSFNQALELANPIAEGLNVPIFECIKKTRDVTHQATLGFKERLKNIKDIFELTDKDGLKNSKILLVDDVMTTGATVEECSRILRKARPKSITAITAAH